MPLPKTLLRTIKSVYGNRSNSWIEQFDNNLQRHLKEWKVSNPEPFNNLTYNYVAQVTAESGKTFVLKAGFPNIELQSEVECLKLFSSDVAVKIIECNLKEGFVLMEKVDPGTPLKQHPDDDEATNVAINIMKKLWISVPDNKGFRSIKDWSKGFEKYKQKFGDRGPIAFTLINEAERTYNSSKESEWELLHGDLHHDNILESDRVGYLLIDPKGILGPPVYELGAWLRNPPLNSDKQDWLAITKRRIDQFSTKLNFSKSSIVEWAIAQAVLSAWWMIDDGMEERVAEQIDWIDIYKNCL